MRSSLGDCNDSLHRYSGGASIATQGQDVFYLNDYYVKIRFKKKQRKIKPSFRIGKLELIFFFVLGSAMV